MLHLLLLVVSLLLAVACSHVHGERWPAESTRGEGQANPDVSSDSSSPSVPNKKSKDKSSCNPEAELEENVKTLKLLNDFSKKLPLTLQADEKNQKEHLKFSQNLNLSGESCEAYTNLLQEIDIGEGRLKNITATMEYLGEIKKLELPAQEKIMSFSMPKKQMICLFNCENKQAQQNRNYCASECKTSLDLAQKFYELFVEDDDAESEAAKKTCPDSSQQQAEKIFSVIEESVKFIKDYYSNILPKVNKAVARYQQLIKYYENKLKVHKSSIERFTGTSCERDHTKLVTRIKESIRRAYVYSFEESSGGTSFYIQGASKGEAIPVTAHHVSFFGDKAQHGGAMVINEYSNESDRLRDKKSFEELGRSVLQRMKEGQVDIYGKEPGLYDKANDVTLGPARYAQDALPVIGSNERPKLGQKFILAGFPGNRNRDFNTYQCQFKGYGNARTLYGHDSWNGLNRDNFGIQEMGYVMYCPSLEGHPGGISGGPMVDEQGRAWGVNSAADLFGKNLVVISPISKDSAGKVQIGIQGVVTPMRNGSKGLSKDCYRLNIKKNEFENYSCQAFSGCEDLPFPRNQNEFEDATKNEN